MRELRPALVALTLGSGSPVRSPRRSTSPFPLPFFAPGFDEKSAVHLPVWSPVVDLGG